MDSKKGPSFRDQRSPRLCEYSQGGGQEQSTRSRRIHLCRSGHEQATFVTRGMEGSGFGSAREAWERMEGALKDLGGQVKDRIERDVEVAEREVQKWKDKCTALQRERDELRIDVECAKRVAVDLKRKKDIYRNKYEEIKRKLDEGSRGCKRNRPETGAASEEDRACEGGIRSKPGSRDGSASQEVDALVLHCRSAAERSTPDILDEGLGTAKSAPGPLSLRLSAPEDDRENQAFEANVSEELLERCAGVKEEASRPPGPGKAPSAWFPPSSTARRTDPSPRLREGGSDWTDPIEVLEDTPTEAPSPAVVHVGSDAFRSSPPGYKYATVVRGRVEREALPAHDCAQCRGFYEALGEEVSLFPCQHHQEQDPVGAPRRADASPFRQFVGRHRACHAPPPTPTGYWDIGFGTPEEGGASPRR